MLNLLRPVGLFRKIWFWFLLLITFNQGAILFTYYEFIVKPTASSLTTVFMGLADAVEKGRANNDLTSFGVLKDGWVSEKHIMVISGPPQNLVPAPLYPALWVMESKLRSDWGDRVQFGYSASPERTIWLYFPKVDKPFSVGIPFSDRLKTQSVMLLVIALIFIFTIVAASVISLHFGRPLQALATEARKLGRGEVMDLENSINSDPAEVATLAIALKQMQGEIHQMQNERERFLAGIAHDLRTPLSRMRVAIEFPEIRNTTLADGLQEDIEDMRAILDQFIELTKLDTEKSELYVVGDIGKFIDDIVLKYIRSDAPVTYFSQGSSLVRYKPVALTRLVYNLIDNALRHGVGGVSVSVISTPKIVSLSVCNSLGGASHDSALIKALRWVDGGYQSGLGSAIIRRLADVHEARLKLDASKADTFNVSIEFDVVG